MTNGHRPVASRVQDMIYVNPSRNVKHVRMFAAMKNFIHIHVKDRADILELLTRLTNDDEKFV